MIDRKSSADNQNSGFQLSRHRGSSGLWIPLKWKPVVFIKLMKTRWHIKDLIDLEYFLHIDADDATQTPRLDIDARDREIFLKNIQPRLSETKSNPRRFIIKSWLDRRCEMERDRTGTQAFLPGETLAETSRLLGYGLFILGGLSGIGLAFSLLTYTGTAPLNISVYLGITVFVQILFLLLLGGLLLIRLIRPRLFYTSVIYSVLSRLIIALAGKLKQRYHDIPFRCQARRPVSHPRTGAR